MYPKQRNIYSKKGVTVRVCGLWVMTHSLINTPALIPVMCGQEDKPLSSSTSQSGTVVSSLEGQVSFLQDSYFRSSTLVKHCQEDQSPLPNPISIGKTETWLQAWQVEKVGSQMPLFQLIHRVKVPGARVRNSAHGKGHEEGGFGICKGGIEPQETPCSRASTPKTRVCPLYCFMLSPTPLTLWGGSPPSPLSEKELTYSSS